MLLVVTGPVTMQCQKPAVYQSQEQQTLPKLLNLKKGKMRLLYFGTYHSNDPTDSLFDLLTTSFATFKPRYVLHEGGSNWPVYASKDSTIRESGEPGFTIQLAREAAVPVSSIEPSMSEEFESLNQLYNRTQVILMYFCRQIDQQQRLHRAFPMTDAEFERNISYFLENLQRSGIPMNKQELQVAYWKQQYQDFFKEPLDWRNFDPGNYYPNFYRNQLNEINRSSDQFRNDHMISTIIKTLEAHEEVMVVVGGGHLFAQEDVLRSRFQEVASKRR